MPLGDDESDPNAASSSTAAAASAAGPAPGTPGGEDDNGDDLAEQSDGDDGDDGRARMKREPRRRVTKVERAEAGRQADDDSIEWMSFGLGKAMRLLHSPNEADIRRTLRLLHVRFFHAPAERMRELLAAASVPPRALRLMNENVSTCRVCRTWTRPGERSMTQVRIAKTFNEAVQWDILFVYDDMVSHMVDEAIRWAAGGKRASAEATDLITNITHFWLDLTGR